METIGMISDTGNLEITVIENYISAFNEKIQQEIITCAEKIEKILNWYDLEKYRKCLEPSLYV